MTTRRGLWRVQGTALHRQPGAVVTEVARRWQVCPQQVFGWRRQARKAAQAEPSPAALEFVPIVPEALPDPAPTALPSPPAPPIEVKLAGAMLRISPGTDAALLTAVLRAIRASAT
jgi:transposase